MAAILKHQEFDTLEGYREFYRKCQDAGSNTVDMYVPQVEANKQAAATRVLITDPDHDHNLLKALLEDDRLEGAVWKIAPVRLTLERLENTDKLNFRVRLRKRLVPEYRRDMKNGAFFPLLVFLVNDDYWDSGRHRAEAAGKWWGAVYALVFENLTPAQALIVGDTTNRWHSEKWDEDESASVAYEYVQRLGWSKPDALKYMGLDPVKDKDLLLAAQLWSRHKDIIKVAEEGIGGKGGRPLSFRTLAKAIVPFGREDAVTSLSKKEWMNIIHDKTGALTKVKSAGIGGERLRQENGIPFGDQRKSWVLQGANPKEKYRHFLVLQKRAATLSETAKSGVKEVADDYRWMAFIHLFNGMSDAALWKVKAALSSDQLEETRTLLERITLVFSAHADSEAKGK